MQSDDVRAELEAMRPLGLVKALAFDTSGARCVAVPAQVIDLVDEVLPGDEPLEFLHPDSFGPAVATYELARQAGRATTPVTLPDGSAHQLTIINAADSLSCFLAVIQSHSEEPLPQREPHHVTPRRFSATLSASGSYLDVDSNFCRRLGWSREEVIDAPSLDLIHPDDHDRSIVAWAELLQDPGGEHRIRQRFETSDGGWVWVETTDRNLLADPDRRCIEADMVDISDEMAVQQSLHEREQLLARLTEALPSGVMQVDHNGRVQFVNTRWEEITGYAGVEQANRLIDTVEDPESLDHAVRECLDKEKDRDLEVVFKPGSPKEGRHVLVRLRAMNVAAETGLLLVIDDVTADRSHRRQLEEIAERDPMTGVLNRRGVLNRLDALLADGEVVTVMFCDLDQLKEINDSSGHAVGDEAIRRVAQVLDEAVRADDLVGRLGGDEFLVVLASGAEAAVASAAERINAGLAELDTEDEAFPIAVSIGTARARRGESSESLIGRADGRMYEAKSRRRTPTDDA